MGTSSSFKGPKNNSSLLPSWATSDDDYESPPAPPYKENDIPLPADSPPTLPTDNGSNEPEGPADDDTEKPTVPDSGNEGQPNPTKPAKKPPKAARWSDAKNAMSRFGRDSGNSTALKNAGRAYVRARGGAQGAARAAGRGTRAIAGLGGFLGDVVQRGFNEALQNAGIRDCVGKPAEEVFAKLADHLAPAGGPIDEGITRKAILDSLCYLYDKLTDENGEIQHTDALGRDEVKEALMLATQHYIYQKWLNEVGIALERKEVTEAELIEAETTVKDFVGESVRITFRNVNVTTFSFQNPTVTDQINSIFQETYALIEQ